MLAQIHAVDVFEPEIGKSGIHLYCSDGNHIRSASSIARFEIIFKLFLRKSSLALNVLHDCSHQLSVQIVSVVTGIFHVELDIESIQHFLPGK